MFIFFRLCKGYLQYAIVNQRVVTRQRLSRGKEKCMTKKQIKGVKNNRLRQFHTSRVNNKGVHLWSYPAVTFL